MLFIASKKNVIQTKNLQNENLPERETDIDEFRIEKISTELYHEFTNISNVDIFTQSDSRG